MNNRIVRIMVAVLVLGCLLPGVKVRAATASSKAGAVTTAGGSLNVRAAASANSGVVASLRKGSYITLLSRSGTWWKVEYGKGQYGYCHADYITIVQGTPATVSTLSGPLNVRNGAGTSYARVASLGKGETVLRLTTANGWSRILYHGTKTGYVSAQYLSAEQTPSGYSAVSLNVPGFKQMDSRWAQVKIGTSGKRLVSDRLNLCRERERCHLRKPAERSRPYVRDCIGKIERLNRQTPHKRIFRYDPNPIGNVNLRQCRTTGEYP